MNAHMKPFGYGSTNVARLTQLITLNDRSDEDELTPLRDGEIDMDRMKEFRPTSR